MNRSQLLILVLVVLVAVVGWPYLEPLLSGDASMRAERERREAVIRGNLVDLRLSELTQEGGSYSPQRNIFRFEARKPPPPPPPPPPVRQQDNGPKPPPPPPPPPPVKRPPVFNMSLIGIFGPEGNRLAVFKDGPDLIVNAGVEEVLQEKFIVHTIDIKSVTIKYVGFPDTPAKRLTLDG